MTARAEPPVATVVAASARATDFSEIMRAISACAAAPPAAILRHRSPMTCWASKPKRMLSVARENHCFSIALSDASAGDGTNTAIGSAGGLAVHAFAQRHSRELFVGGFLLIEV